MEKSLDRKLSRILADPACREFIIADAKDADMAFGLASPGRSPEYHGGEARFRTLEEYRSHTGHLQGALLLPVQELEQRISELEQYKDRTLIVYCRVGNRSRFAQMILEAHGFSAANMTGGIVQWNDERRPIVRESNQTPAK